MFSCFARNVLDVPACPGLKQITGHSRKLNSGKLNSGKAVGQLLETQTVFWFKSKGLQGRGLVLEAEEKPEEEKPEEEKPEKPAGEAGLPCWWFGVIGGRLAFLALETTPHVHILHQAAVRIWGFCGNREPVPLQVKKLSSVYAEHVEFIRQPI